MGRSLTLRDDFTAAELKRLARQSRDAGQTRRLLALAVIRETLPPGTAIELWFQEFAMKSRHRSDAHGGRQDRAEEQDHPTLGEAR